MNKQFLGYPSSAIKQCIYLRFHTRKVTLHAEPSNLGTTTGSGRYEIGAVAHIKAIPNDDTIEFLKWSDESTDAERDITVTEHVELTAYFKQTTCTLTLTATPSDGGSVVGSGTYNVGTSVDIKAIPATYYNFVQWSDGDENAERSYLLEQDTSLTATFERQTGTVYFHPGY